MQNNNVRKTIPEPLMFIHTVKTPINVSSSKTYFDSRDQKNHTINKMTKEKIDDLLLKKIKNIVMMNKQGNNIDCLIETINNQSIEGQPSDIIDDYLLLNNNQETKILLKDIFDIIILKL